MDVTARGAPAGARVRALRAWDLIVFGILCVTPIAPLPLFGFAQQLSSGHAATSILLAMTAMLFTAISYGRMASVYPAAGSAFTYIGHALHPTAGFLAGWVMLMDYLLIPTINVIYCSVAVRRFVPALPYPALAGALVLFSTWFNLRGIKTSATAHRALLLAILVVLGAFAIAAASWVVHAQGAAALVSTAPFYRSAEFNWGGMLTATSFAALTYIGFDAVTTLAEDVVDPRRSVPLATTMVCVLTGLVGAALIYLAQLVWPEYGNFPNTETAFLDVARRAGGDVLFTAMTAVVLVSQLGSALTGHAGAGRLLFSMGRDGVLPRRLGVLAEEKRQPVLAVVLVGACTFIAALLLDFEHGAMLLNFGAFIAFMGVNVAAFKTFFLAADRQRRRLFFDAACPLLGFCFCLAIWVGLPTSAKITGISWLFIGAVYVVLRGRRRSRASRAGALSD